MGLLQCACARLNHRVLPRSLHCCTALPSPANSTGLHGNSQGSPANNHNVFHYVLCEKLVIIPSWSYLADKIAYQNILFSRFIWLPTKLVYKMYAFWLVVCLILLSSFMRLAAGCSCSFHCELFLLIDYPNPSS